MDLYTYVATSNPYQAKAILHKYGYSATGVKNNADLGICLKKLVSSEGEDALNDILECHPDKGILLERFATVKEAKDSSKNCSGEGCNCKSHTQEKAYMNFSGIGEKQSPSAIAQQTSIFILAAALLLAAAIIVKN
jgi:hypothetical protein